MSIRHTLLRLIAGKTPVAMNLDYTGDINLRKAGIVSNCRQRPEG